MVHNKDRQQKPERKEPQKLNQSEKKQADKKIDEASKESFPASDPPAWT